MAKTRDWALSGTAFCGAMLMAGGAAFAQPIEEVVVTGSHIHGVAPVGSSIVSIGTEDFQKTASNDAYSLLLKVPQLTNIGLGSDTSVGGNRAQGAAGNTTYTSAINLRGVNAL